MTDSNVLIDVAELSLIIVSILLNHHKTKNYTMDKGGVPLIKDPAFNDHAEVLSEKGTDRSRFMR